MYITTVLNRNSRPAILLRTSYREDGKVLNKTLANLTNWDDLRIEAFKKCNKHLRNFYDPLIAKHKAAKVALVVVMCKLLAFMHSIVKNNSSYNENLC
jgi:hypothetical protein